MNFDQIDATNSSALQLSVVGMLHYEQVVFKVQLFKIKVVHL
ncbi:hypothetical protein [Bacillus sp. JCM 19034]|nr:hypothetical protein [Bacillus sp. JCM 19034]